MKKSGKFQERKKRPPIKRITMYCSAILIVALLGGVAGLVLHKIMTPGQSTEEAVETEAPSTEAVTETAEVPTSEPETTASTTIPTEPPETEPVPEAPAPEDVLKGMTLEQKVFQLFMVRPEDVCGGYGMTECPENLSEILAEKPVGGFIFFADNLKNREQTIAMIQGCQSASRIPLFIGVDEEGGLVSRVGSNPEMGTTRIPAMAEVSGPEAAGNIGSTIGFELLALGFNLDFAPVADVNTNPDNPVIGSRAFSSDPQTAAQMVAACVSGFDGAGMISCLKHFPGHGDTGQDSHYGYAESTKTMEELESTEFLPFRAGIEAGVPIIMMGHITLPNVDSGDNLPASMSPFWMQTVLREKLGFTGLIVTDSLEMGAITGAFPTKGESAVQALLAGTDIILMPDSLSQGAAAILKAVEEGVITEERINESVLRILTLKNNYGILNPS